jgi:hypothetical protein
MVAPNAKVLLFFVLPIPIRVLAWLIVGVAAYTVLAKGHVAGSNAGGDAAHLGGALLGFLLIRSPALLNWQPRLFSAAPRGPGRWQRRQQESRRDTAEVDRILTKVKEHGLHSLSRREKKILQKATEKQRRAG